MLIAHPLLTWLHITGNGGDRHPKAVADRTGQRSTSLSLSLIPRLGATRLEPASARAVCKSPLPHPERREPPPETRGRAHQEPPTATAHCTNVGEREEGERESEPNSPIPAAHRNRQFAVLFLPPSLRARSQPASVTPPSPGPLVPDFRRDEPSTSRWSRIGPPAPREKAPLFPRLGAGLFDPASRHLCCGGSGSYPEPEGHLGRVGAGHERHVTSGWRWRRWG